MSDDEKLQAELAAREHKLSRDIHQFWHAIDWIAGMDPHNSEMEIHYLLLQARQGRYRPVLGKFIDDPEPRLMLKALQLLVDELGAQACRHVNTGAPVATPEGPHAH